MRITRWGEYGILCCLYLARRFNEGPIGASEIAETQSIPIKYAQQILHRLRRGGVIKSVRGPHGGFLLAREPARINLREILFAAEGDTFEVVCDNDPIQHQFCSTKTSCGLSSVWHELKESVNGVLESATLATMMGNQSELPASAQPVLVRVGSEPRFAD